jgi:hypothetical protein
MVSTVPAADPNHWSLSSSGHRRTIMNSLLFVLEIALVMGGIALVPARSDLRMCHIQERCKERNQDNSLRS